MKVYISNYRHHYVNTYDVIDKALFWCQKETKATVSNFLSNSIATILDKIHPKIDYVKIDIWDIYNADTTLAHIICPLLKVFKEKSIGIAMVEDCDVPADMIGDYTDELAIRRWNYVIDEMIFAFTFSAEYKYGDYASAMYDRARNGFRLFGKYYQNLWD